MKEAERKLYEKGYYLSNQFDGFGTVSGEYELADRNGNTVIDHLTEAQVIALVESPLTAYRGALPRSGFIS